MSKSCCICSNNLEQDKCQRSSSCLNLEFVNSFKNTDLSLTLSSELEIIFVLRNLLHLPTNLIADLLKESHGENPSDWGLLFCSPCHDLVIEAHGLFMQINGLIQEYGKIGRRLRTKVKLSPVRESKKGGRKRRSGRNVDGDNDTQLKDKVSLIRRYFMETKSDAGRNSRNRTKLVKVQPLVRNRKKRSRKIQISHDEDGEGTKIVINKVQTIDPDGSQEDFGIKVKLEPEDVPSDMNEEFNSESHFMDDEEAGHFDDADMADFSVQIDPLAEVEEAGTGQRSLRPRRRKEKLTPVSDVEDEDVTHQDIGDHDGWKASASEHEDEYEPKPILLRKRKRRSARPVHEKPEKIRKQRPRKLLPTTNERHLISAKSRKGWRKCPNCPGNCKNVVVYEAHVLRMHQGISRPYTCEICPRKFSHLAAVLTHLDRKHHSEIKHNPEDDEEQAESSSKNDSNSQKQTKELEWEGSQWFRTIFQIDEPQKDENTDVTLMANMPPCEKFNKIFTCRKCDVKFNSRITAELHLQRVHGGIQTKLLCSDCGLLFLTELGRKYHQDDIHPSTPFNPKTYCQECKLDFETPLHLGQHNRHVHRQELIANREKRHMCELCPSTFGDYTDLVAHQRQQHHEALGLTPHKCHICSKVLYSKRNLKAHVATHTKDCEFQCSQCPQGFTIKQQLDHHIRVVHFKEKRHKCPHCPKSFSQTVNLKYHIRTHTGEKPLKCSESGCGKAFSDPPTYKRHMESHGDKIHTCPDCGREFKVRHSYRLHCKTHQRDAGDGKRNTKKNRTVRKKRKEEEEDSESGSDEDSKDRNSNNNSNDILNGNDVSDSQKDVKDLSKNESETNFLSSNGHPQYFQPVATEQFHLVEHSM